MWRQFVSLGNFGSSLLDLFHLDIALSNQQLESNDIILNKSITNNRTFKIIQDCRVMKMFISKKTYLHIKHLIAEISRPDLC